MVYILIAKRPQSTDYLGAFKEFDAAAKAKSELKKLHCNINTQFEIKGMPLR